MQVPQKVSEGTLSLGEEAIFVLVVPAVFWLLQVWAGMDETLNPKEVSQSQASASSCMRSPSRRTSSALSEGFL